jgi:crotonobetainyl-CoA:carnitine CoA-transferase CaiB-like acyl-CoA transferase
MTGMYAAVSVLAALAKREISGKGDHIDLAMLDVQVGYLADQAMNSIISGQPPRRNGNAHPNIQPQDVFACRDGHLALAVGNDAQFGKLCIALGHPEWAKDSRFVKNADRVRNREALTALIAQLLGQGSARDWVARIEAEGVPSAVINTVPMVFEEPQVVHREMLRQMSHALAGTVPQVVSPMRFRESPLSFERPPPLLGEHTAEILRELELDEAPQPKHP